MFLALMGVMLAWTTSTMRLLSCATWKSILLDGPMISNSRTPRKSPVSPTFVNSVMPGSGEMPDGRRWQRLMSSSWRQERRAPEWRRQSLGLSVVMQARNAHKRMGMKQTRRMNILRRNPRALPKGMARKCPMEWSLLKIFMSRIKSCHLLLHMPCSYLFPQFVIMNNIVFWSIYRT